MAALTCEICGGKLVGKPGGIFECDSCGMEYSTEWAKAKIQEIKGTVKVEGTVEVQGTVKLDGPIQIKQDAKRDRYLHRGWELLKYREWKPAKKEFETALEADPESAEAYLGIFCSFTRRENMEMIAQIGSVSSLERDEFQRAKRYAVGELKQKLQAYEVAVQENENRAREARERREAENAAFEAAEVVRLAPLRTRIQPARGLIAAGKDHVLAVKTDGTVLSAGRNSYKKKGTYAQTGYGQVGDVRLWSDIIAVAAGEEHSVGLKSDGTVVAVGRNEELQCEVRTWRGITAIAAGQYCTVGLQRDGHVILTGHYERLYGGYGHEEPSEGNRMLDAEYWHDIVWISADGDRIHGLRSDGTCVKMARAGKVWKTSADSREKDIVEYYGWRLRTCGRIEGLTSYTDLITIDNHYSRTIGIKSDGTCWIDNELLPGMETWTDLVAVASSSHFCVGLKKDGTLVAAREEDSEDHGQCGVSGWKLFDNLENIDQERVVMRQKKREKDARIKAIEEERSALWKEKFGLGFFSKKREKQIEARIAELDAKLQEEKRS